MIKKNWIYILFVVAVMVFITQKLLKRSTNEPKPQKLSLALKVIQVNVGFGYEIYNNQILTIKQTVIPAIDGEKVFINETQAKQTGQLVIYKMEQGLMPNITIHELDRLKIIR